MSYVLKYRLWKKSDNFKAVDFKVIYLFTGTYVYTCTITNELRNRSDMKLCYRVPCFDHGYIHRSDNSGGRDRALSDWLMICA